MTSDLWSLLTDMLDRHIYEQYFPQKTDWKSQSGDQIRLDAFT